MNRKELVRAIAEDTGNSEAACSHFLDTFIAVVQSTVAAGDKVRLNGFGNFTAVTIKERKMRNPANGEALVIAASICPKFTAGKNFKSVVGSRYTGTHVKA